MLRDSHRRWWSASCDHDSHPWLFSPSRRFARSVIRHQTTGAPAYQFIAMGICDVLRSGYFECEVGADWKSVDHVAHRSNSVQVSRPRVAGEPTVWIARKDHAYKKRKVPKRDDRSHGHTYYSCAAHLHRFEGPRLWSLGRARDLYHFGCEQEECDKSKVRCKAATSNSTYRGATIEVFSAVAAIDVGAIGRGAR